MLKALARCLPNRRTSTGLADDRWIAAALAVLVVVVAIPGALMGTGFLREDWREMARIHNCGVYHCGTSDIRVRPIMETLYWLTYIPLGHHPSVSYWILNAMLAATAAMVFLTLRGFVSRYVALAIVALWALSPTHSALQHWTAEIHIVSSLLFLAGGLFVLSRRQSWFAILLFVASVVTYEATLPVALGALLVFPKLMANPLNKRFTLPAVAILTALGIGLIVLQLDARPYDVLAFGAAFDSIFAFGAPGNVFYKRLAIAGALIATVALARLALPSWRHSSGHGERLVLAGLVIIILGALPFATTGYDSMFFGLGDRANMVAGFGSAMLWAGVALTLARREVIAIAITCVLALALIPLDIDRADDFAYVYKHTEMARSAAAGLPRSREGYVEIVDRNDARYRQMSTSFTAELDLALKAEQPPVTGRFHKTVDPGIYDPLPITLMP